ncbi:MAG: hypothetical protein QOF92_1264 [Pseudonocardiales bacterium]|jgi:hypothetical protein|nr:hypothetical protein [Pseudonocardiales bacterium]
MTQGNPGYGPPPGQQPGGYGAPQPGGYQPSQSGGYGGPQPGGYGAPPSNPYGGGPPSQSFGVVGAAIAVVGAALVVVAFTALNWFKGNGSSKVSDIHKVLDGAPSNTVSGLANAYFSWLGWVLLALAAIIAIAANAPSPASGALRGVGVVVGLGAAVLTLFAIKLSSGGPDLTAYLKDGRVGFYATLAGFVLIAVGAAIGPRRV